MAITIDFHPLEDSCVWKEYLDSNYGSVSELRVSHYRTSNAYLKFDLSDIPSGSSIIEAVLSLHAKTRISWGDSNAPKIDPTIRVHSVLSNEWDEKTITYNNAPKIDETPLDSKKIMAENTEYTFNVKSFVEKQLKEGKMVMSLALTALEEHSFLSGVRFSSKEDSPQAPKLQISYEPPTTTPTAD